MEGAAQQRRLATILAADVAGYSGLMAQDEEATVRTLQAHRAVIDRLIERHDGRIFNTAGDSVVAEFASAVEAVRCAITAQDELRVRNAELIPERRLLWRIGVNVGDVLVAGGDLLGDGVNIAARLESIAAPGGICISGSTFEQVKNKLSVGFEDLGPQRVKNIPEPIAAFGITAAPVTLAGRHGAAATAPLRGPRWPAVAVGALLLAAVVAVAAWWQFAPRGARSLADFPENVTTDDLSARDVAALMTGVTISGNRVSDNVPFLIALKENGVVEYRFGNAVETGRWWADEHRFCLQVPKFMFGQQLCPRIVKSGGSISAHRPTSGQALPWTVKK